MIDSTPRPRWNVHRRRPAGRRQGPLALPGLLTLLLLTAAYAAPGNLDPTFNPGGTGSVPAGTAMTSFGSLDDIGTCMAVQTDGKIVLAGYSDARGSVDVTVQDDGYGRRVGAGRPQSAASQVWTK